MVSGQINNLTGKGGNKLSLTELEYLKANTKYDEGDIREWYRSSHNIYQFFMGSTILIFLHIGASRLNVLMVIWVSQRVLLKIKYFYMR